MDDTTTPTRGFEDQELLDIEVERDTRPLCVPALRGMDGAERAYKSIALDGTFHQELKDVCTHGDHGMASTPADPLFVDVLVFIYNTLLRYQSGRLTSDGTPGGEITPFQMSRLRIVMSGLGHQNYCQALARLELMDQREPTLSSTETYAEWEAALEEACRVTGWPTSTTTLSLRRFLLFLSRLQDPQETKGDDEAQPPQYGQDFVRWAEVAVLCALCRQLVVKISDRNHEILVEDGNYCSADFIRLRTTRVPLTFINACNILEPFGVDAAAKGASQVVKAVATAAQSILVSDIPKTVNIARDIPRRLKPDWVVMGNHRRVVSKARGAPLSSSTAISGAVRIRWEELQSSADPMAVPPRLSRLSDRDVEPAGHTPEHRDFTIPDGVCTTYPWDVYLRFCKIWVPWDGEVPEGHNQTLIEAAATVTCAIPAFWGAFRDLDEGLHNTVGDASGWKGYCPGFVFQPFNPCDRAATSNGGKSTSCETIAGSSSLTAAACWYHYGQREAGLTITGNATDDPSRRAAEDRADAQGMIIQEELQEAGRKTVIAYDTLTSVITGQPWSVGQAYSNTSRTLHLRYGYYAVAKYMPTAVSDLTNRLTPMWFLTPDDPRMQDLRNRYPDMDTHAQAMKSGRVSYLMALSAHIHAVGLLEGAKRIRESVTQAVTDGLYADRGKDAYRFDQLRYVHAAMTHQRAADIGAPCTDVEAYDATLSWRKLMEEKWAAMQEVARNQGSTMSNHNSQELDLDFASGELRVVIPGLPDADEWAESGHEPITLSLHQVAYREGTRTSLQFSNNAMSSVGDLLPPGLRRSISNASGAWKASNWVNLDRLVELLHSVDPYRVSQQRQDFMRRVFPQNRTSKSSQSATYLFERVERDGYLVKKADSYEIHRLRFPGTFFALEARRRRAGASGTLQSQFRVVPAEGAAVTSFNLDTREGRTPNTPHHSLDRLREVVDRSEKRRDGETPPQTFR